MECLLLHTQRHRSAVQNGHLRTLKAWHVVIEGTTLSVTAVVDNTDRKVQAKRAFIYTKQGHLRLKNCKHPGGMHEWFCELFSRHTMSERDRS